MPETMPPINLSDRLHIIYLTSYPLDQKHKWHSAQYVQQQYYYWGRVTLHSPALICNVNCACVCEDDYDKRHMRHESESMTTATIITSGGEGAVGLSWTGLQGTMTPVYLQHTHTVPSNVVTINLSRKEVPMMCCMSSDTVGTG